MPVAGAEVTITHVESGTVSRATTDANGRIPARGLRVGGPYTVTVTRRCRRDTEGERLPRAEPGQAHGRCQPQQRRHHARHGAGQWFLAEASVFSANKVGAGTSVSQNDIKNLPSINGNIQDFMRLDPRVASPTAPRADERRRHEPASTRSPSTAFPPAIPSAWKATSMPTMRQPVSMEGDRGDRHQPIELRRDHRRRRGRERSTRSGSRAPTSSMARSTAPSGRRLVRRQPVTGAPFTEFTDEKTYGFTLGGPILKEQCSSSRTTRVQATAPSPT